MTLESSGQNKLSGKYNYKGKTSFLDLSGDISEEILFLEESYKGKLTGSFYLEYREDSLVGKWAHENRSYDVGLAIASGDRSVLDYFGVEERSASCSDEVSGSYEIEYYFINDYFFEENKPTLEVGYNGAEAVLEKIDENQIRFYVEAICGPTYHYAFAEGIAKRVPEEPNTFRYVNEDGCEITIVLDIKEVSISANASMECGFGARAYLDHTLLKVSDEVNFEIER